MHFALIAPTPLAPEQVGNEATTVPVRASLLSRSLLAPRTPLLLQSITCELSRSQVQQFLWLKLSKCKTMPQIWVLWVLQVEKYRSILAPKMTPM
mmetsp:Transcript_24271/g.52372  ORF Transcript_24271/g.52372 Transcript_24271/m.52372 type:complete len:95 (-) Transcript_24271:456-740(-)